MINLSRMFSGREWSRIGFGIFGFLLFLVPISGSSQTATIKGTVTESESKEALIGVKIIMDSSGGALTDADGKFELKTTAGKHKLRLLYEGYSPTEIVVLLTEGEAKEMAITLSTKVSDMDIVVISGSRYEKRLAEETVSIDVVKPYLIENTNATDLADVAKKVPGVSIVDGQASIRGGSGYSYGAGSRVAILVDDLPMLSADLSEIRWNFIPLETIEQVEVIKGAASALYGSAATNGVIHVRTGWASEKPQTQVMLYQNVWDNPRDPLLRWWNKNEQPFQTGLMVSHRRRIKNLDIVAGAHYNQTRNYLQYGDNMRGRLNVKTRYKSQKVKGLTFGLNANVMWEKFGRFFMWAGDGDSSYIPLQAEQRESYLLMAIDPHAAYVTPKGGIHSLRGRYYYIRNYLYEDERMFSKNYYGEYQYMKHFNHNLSVTTGLVNNTAVASTNVLDYNKYISEFGAGYVQVEKKWKPRLTVAGGLRYEVNTVVDTTSDGTFKARLEKSGPTFRGGMNYQVGEASFLRASWGQSYRFPTLVERFIRTDFLGVYLFPNPALVSEKGWSSEIGFKQGLRIGKWQGFLDAAVFLTQYKNLMEFTVVFEDNKFGFKTQNISDARIAGLELGGMGEGKIGPIDVRLFGGYTFVYPGDLQSDSTQRKFGKFLSNVSESFTSVDSLQKSLLRYRYRHQLRMDIELGYKRFYLGANFSYYSFMDKIDPIFEIFPGVKNFRTNNAGGIFFFDMRFGAKISENATLSLMVKNAGNTVYSLRPGMMEAPRSITVQYKYKF